MWKMKEKKFESDPEQEVKDEQSGTNEVVDINENQKNMLELKHPIMINGDAISKLEYDFDALTAKDLHEASKYLKQIGIPVTVPAMDQDYQMVIFARAVKKKMHCVTINDLMRLNAVDTMKATGIVRNFLLDLDPAQKELGSEE